MSIVRKIINSYYVYQSGSNYKDVSFNLKAVINKEKIRVLFAEVNNDFVDLLFSFLILPIGVILQVFEKHYGDKTPHVIGSLKTLYNGLANLRGICFQSTGNRPEILNTGRAYAFPHVNMQFKFFEHQRSYNLGEAYFVVYNVFTTSMASFIISDDLRIVPNLKGSIVQTLNSVGVDMADMDGSETRYVTIGFNEVMDFLKGLMISRQPLTDIIILDTLAKPKSNKVIDFVRSLLIFSQPQTDVILAKPEPQPRSCISVIPLHQIQKDATSKSKKMILKAMFQKSTKKFLFAQAEFDFIKFLFELLCHPLGLIDSHLGRNTYINKLCGLYGSIADLIDVRNLHPRFKYDLMKTSSFFSYYIFIAINDICGADGPRMYMVTDDLTVTRLCATSAFSVLGEMKISSSDVEEVEHHIRLEEAQNILKASLTSSCAISNGLISSLLRKQQKLPKQEHH